MIDKLEGYRITKMSGAWHLHERRVVTTPKWWGMWASRSYYTVFIKTFNNWDSAREHINTLVAEAHEIVESDDYTVRGSLECPY